MSILFKIGATILGLGFFILLVFVVGTFYLQPGHQFFMDMYRIMVFFMVLGVCTMGVGALVNLWRDED